MKYCFYICVTVLLLCCSRQNDNKTSETIVGEFIETESQEINQNSQEYNIIQNDNALEHPLSVFTIVDKSPFKYSLEHRYNGYGYINFLDIVYGNGRFVTVGLGSTGSFTHGYIAYSDDGLIWNLVDMFYRNWFFSVAYGNGRFVTGATNGETFYSDDGIEWKVAEGNDFGILIKIIYGKDLFVALYRSGIVYSYDGEIWHKVGNIFEETEITCLFYGNNRFYAGSHGKFAYSYDGKIWNIVENNAFDSLPIHCFAYGNNRLLAFSYRPDESSYAYGEYTEYSVHIAYSDDGEKWFSKELENNILKWKWINIVYNNGYFIAVGGEGGELKVAFSRDGISWINVNDEHNPYSPNYYTRYYASAYGGGNYVIVGNEGTIRVSQWPIYDEQK